MTAPNSQSLWNASVVGAGGVSASANLNGLASRAIAVTVSAATTLTIQTSRDNTTWTTTGAALTFPGSGQGTINVSHELDVLQTVSGDSWVRLQSSAACTITATLTGQAY